MLILPLYSSFITAQKKSYNTYISSSGLRKVKDTEKTHKNPELRGSSVVKDQDVNKNKKIAAPAKSAAVAAPVKKPPRLENVNFGKKWECVCTFYILFYWKYF